MTRWCGLTTEPFLFLQTGCFIVNSLILPQFLQDRICRNLYNSTICDTLSTTKSTPHEDHIQKLASWWLSVIIPSSSILTLTSICFIGPLSDIVGKRRVMIAVPIFSLIQAILLMILSKVSGYFHPAWLFIPMFTPPLMGDIHGALLLALAYKADTSNRGERTRIMARTEGFFFSSVILVGLFSGLVLKQWGYVAAFAGNAIMSTVSFLYVILLLPDEKVVEQDEETVLIQKSDELGDKDIYDSDSQLHVPGERVTSILNLRQIRKVLTTRSEGHSIAIYLVFLLSGIFSVQGFFFISSLYLSHSPFNLRKDNLGYFMAFTATLVSCGCWFMVPLLQHFARLDDTGLLITGYLATTVLLILYGIANAAWMMYVFALLTLLSNMPLPVSRSMITKHVSDDLHGSSLAVAEVVDVVASTSTNFLSSFIYSQTVSIYPGIVTFVLSLGGLVGLICSISFWYWKRKTRAISENS